jgi:hypothetical protein
MFCNLYFSDCAEGFREHNFSDWGGSLAKWTARQVHFEAIEADLTSPGRKAHPAYVATVAKTVSPECYAAFVRAVAAPVRERDYYPSKLFQFFYSPLLARCGTNEDVEAVGPMLAQLLNGLVDFPFEQVSELQWDRFYADAAKYGLLSVVEAMPSYMTGLVARQRRKDGRAKFTSRWRKAEDGTVDELEQKAGLATKQVSGLRGKEVNGSAVIAVGLAPGGIAKQVEQHFTPKELAELWALDQSTVRRLFRDEPGVLRIPHLRRHGKRDYTSLRIPASVAARVHERRSRSLFKIQ